MKVVGLVSGGKDSCFNLMKCVANGHEIVCLANLYPSATAGADEIDSYMFQSVAHKGVELYSQACGLPLYRREIHGRPLNVNAHYEPTDEDEVEDLYELIKEVKIRHPDVGGVSVGAILSSYQKVRVESVCKRLCMRPLCYLWEADQAKLLDEMIEARLHAIIVKVAALGLNEKHIGKSLAEVRDYLHELNAKYGVHICGEGGEYETFVLDCPLFKKRIVVDEFEQVVHLKDECAPVIYLSFKKLHLEEKL
ncbi:Diphthine--ammonia ligase [Toxocara canis]|uniref:Diphthine--ammonia ligase n=1 Tax=Toxocara canis TaxID=6265 RepID=A0A0B2V604_TOXCA|nr:Diphthine--ammonia ligase [Toxocara canis]